jgi:hypothetical protein
VYLFTSKFSEKLRWNLCSFCLRQHFAVKKAGLDGSSRVWGHAPAVCCNAPGRPVMERHL